MKKGTKENLNPPFFFADSGWNGIGDLVQLATGGHILLLFLGLRDLRVQAENAMAKHTHHMV